MAAITSYPPGISCPRNERPGETDIAQLRNIMQQSGWSSEKIKDESPEILKFRQGVASGDRTALETFLPAYKNRLVQKINDLSTSVIQKLTKTVSEESKGTFSVWVGPQGQIWFAKPELAQQTTQKEVSSESLSLTEIMQLANHAQSLCGKQIQLAENIIETSKSMIQNPPKIVSQESEGTLSVRIWFDGRTDLTEFKDIETLPKLAEQTTEKEAPVIDLTETVQLPGEFESSFAKMNHIALERFTQALHDFVPPSRIVVDWELRYKDLSSRQIHSYIPALNKGSLHDLSTLKI